MVERHKRKISTAQDVSNTWKDGKNSEQYVKDWKELMVNDDRKFPINPQL